MDIHQLSEYELYQLKSIDPTLSSNWLQIVQKILPKLNKQSQYSVYKNILLPRGIIINSNKKLIYKCPDSLAETMSSIHTSNKDLLSISKNMLSIVESKTKNYEAIILADRVEALLGYIDNLDVEDSLIDRKNRQKIRIAFLYDLAMWIDTIQLSINAGLRQLDNETVKSYFKEVFIKQQIQGRDFRNCDSSDLSFQELSHLPNFIIKEGKDRKFFIVEGESHWFLVGSADQPDKNPYSFRRFLHEDCSGSETNIYIYLTHITLKKALMSNEKYMLHASYCMTRLYTLDRGVSNTVLKFVHEIQLLQKQYLRPLLKEALQQDGSHPEVVIRQRMIKYEKQLSILILQKLPGIVAVTVQDHNDQNYLFYHLDQILKQMIDNIQDFRLQPLAMYSTNSEIMAVKLISMRKILSKSRNLLYTSNNGLEENSETVRPLILTIRKKIEETESSLKDLQVLKENIHYHTTLKQSGSFWQKIKAGKKPEYSLDDIIDIQISLQEAFFISIVRLAKTEKQNMVYPEFECNEVVNEHYRHYAVADGKLGLSRLPRVLRLNEDRNKFNIESIKEAIYQDIFKSNQEWNPHA